MRQRFLLLAMMLFAGLSSLAQTAALKGHVLDVTGAVVADAKVNLIATDQSVLTTTSDKLGAYSFTAVRPGEYTVEAEASGLILSPSARTVLASGTNVLDLELRVKEVQQSLTVEQDAENTVSMESASNASALVLTGEDLEALSDNPDDLMADLQALAGPSAGPNGGAIYIDGFSSGDLPAKNAIREIRVNQNPFSAEYDKLGYGRIEIFTKPGSDKYHATADYNFANRFWNSRNPYSPEKAPFLLNEFEGGASGPLGKRASFTVDAQENMVDNGAIVNAVTVDPAAFAVTPYTSTVTSPQRFTKVSPRLDYQLSPNNTLSFRYGIIHADILDTGVGSFDLTSRGYDSRYTNQTVQAAETAVLGQTINETRFQFYRNNFQTAANTVAPVLKVSGAFTGGGAASARSFDVQNSFELQNNTFGTRGAHTWKVGMRLRAQTDDNLSPQNFDGTYTFAGGAIGPVLDNNNLPVPGQLQTISAIERYRRTLLFQKLGYSASQIRALGGGASEFSIAAGQPESSVRQFDFGFFASDDWHVSPNVSLGLGLRCEGQSNIHDWRDWAPRISIAWAPGGRKKTVIRAGFGTFYDRFALSNTLAAVRYNGTVQQQYVVANPDSFPTIPSLQELGAAQTQSVEKISPNLRAPYIMQSAVTVERQLARNTTLALTYTNAHGLHMLRSRDVNAPLPGTFDPGVAGSGVFPLGHPGPVFLMESSGLYNQNQLVANVKTKVNATTSLFAFYVLNKASSNTDGVSTFPANPNDVSGEYGPAATDVRHRVTAGGSVAMRWSVRISPYVVIQSGAPFDVTTGSDLYGTTLFNSRPGLATDPSKAGLIQTAYGLLDPSPSAGERLLGRNYGRGPGQVTLNLRIGKAFGFGPEKGEHAGKSAEGSVQAEPVSNRGLRSVLGSPATARRYNLSVSMSARNLLNHNNPGPIIGDITSSLFGRSNQIAGMPNGEGFYETANNRRIEMQVRLTF